MMVKRVFPYQNHLQMCNRRGAQCAPAKRLIWRCIGAHCAPLRKGICQRFRTMVNSSSLRSFSILHPPFQLLSRRRKNHPRKSRVVFYLSHCSVSSHERGQLLNPLQRERRERHRLHGDGHQLHRVIVSRCAVGMQHAAPAAARSPGSSSTCRLDRQFGQ